MRKLIPQHAFRNRPIDPRSIAAHFFFFLFCQGGSGWKEGGGNCRVEVFSIFIFAFLLVGCVLCCFLMAWAWGVEGFCLDSPMGVAFFFVVVVKRGATL
ncbi:hypothetical protein L873DRAFT_944125 [Choiromyces venosus 120613-1]|uniref:Transmembrane protein n=1 Tax=Choiromyces venosus 120613-1 TaxID=1336337 RepID=A0A3N4K6V8_9PEZI|nr:hypothetical protein L873DRAFT_944125 [Choiromyces venosus 120613-1]